jgi:hypothetical protein
VSERERVSERTGKGRQRVEEKGVKGKKEDTAEIGLFLSIFTIDRKRLRAS